LVAELLVEIIVPTGVVLAVLGAGEKGGDVASICVVRAELGPLGIFQRNDRSSGWLTVGA